jgi:pyruvate,water dikinase
MGFDNVVVMIPFCRSPEEADKVLEVMGNNGLKRGKNGLQVYVMCEIPSNVIRAEEFAETLRRLLHRLERPDPADARRRPRLGRTVELFSEADPAVMWMIETAIAKAHARGRKSGFAARRRRTTRPSPSSW